MANVSGALAPQPKAAPPVKEVTTASFRADVLTASTRQPVLVDFWAPWCGPCKQLAPALEKAVADSGGKVALVKMNIDDHPQIPGQLGIQSIPAVIAFDKGQPVDGFVGALPESQIRGFIERLVGPLEGGTAALVAEADELAAKGDADGAAALYSEVLAEEPGDAKAIGGLAKLHVAAGRLNEAKALLETAPAAAARQGARSGGRRRLCGAAPGRTGLECGRASAARAGGRRQSRRSSGALRSCGRAVGQGGSGGRRRSVAGTHPARSQLERSGGAQTIVAAIRSLGSDGPRVGRGPAQAVGDMVLMTNPPRAQGEQKAMKLNRTFAGPAEMPATIPLFPLAGALLLPRRPIQLTVFEPRYLEMLDHALSGERLIGVIQPSIEEEAADPAPELYPLGCAGRIVQYAEIGDGRCFLTLMGVARFHMTAEARPQGSYRIAIADYSPFAEDFREGAGEAAVDRDDLLETLKRFAEVNEIKVVWSDIKKASNEALVNGLSMMSPCGPKEKQALLEAKDLKSRAEMLVAITTIELARGQDAAMQIH